MPSNRSVADSFGWPYPSRELSVESLIAVYSDGQGSADLQAVLAILRSIRASGFRDEIDVVCTSMLDVLVRVTGNSQPPFDVVRISPSLEGVTITHQSTTGLNDSITRPTDEAVPLFWRFMKEKFGVGRRSGA